MNDADPQMTVTLSFSAWSQIVALLQKGPFDQVLGLINELNVQLSPQIEAALLRAKEAATAPADTHPTAPAGLN